MLIGYILFAVVLFRDLDQRNEMVRVAIPPFSLLGLLVVPAAMNVRKITVSSNGVTVKNMPIPKGANHDIPRNDIRACTVRHIRSKTKHGYVSTYTAGVDSGVGQIDIAYPYSKYEEAWKIAEQFASALNHGAVTRRISVESTNHEPASAKSWKRKVLLWLGAFIVAVILGGVWEVSSQGR
jgi:hypothetical protein